LPQPSSVQTQLLHWPLQFYILPVLSSWLIRVLRQLAEVSIDTTVDCPKPAKLKDSLGHPL